MTPRQTRERTGATLIELLVAIAIFTALASLALMLLPSIANRDMTLKGAGEVQGTCKIAQGMAASARQARGVRLLCNNTWIATEMQLLEMPEVVVSDPEALVAKPSDPTGVNGPRLEFVYDLAPAGGSAPANSIVRRHCYIAGLTSDQEAQLANGAVLVLPTLGAWSRLIDNPDNPSAGPVSVVNNSPRTLEVYLEVYPDMVMGAGTSARTYHFAIYGPPVPLLGEPTILLPKDIGIDLEVSFPPPPAPPRYYDIMFSPSGQTITTYPSVGSFSVTGNTNVFLWVRDITKVPSMRPVSMSPWRFDPAQNQFKLGGDHQIVGIRNGFIGTAPVQWPDNAGNYTGNDDPYTEARKRLN